MVGEDGGHRAANTRPRVAPDRRWRHSRPRPHQARLALGALGLPALCATLRKHRADPPTVRGVLECLALALGVGAGPPLAGGPAPGTLNAELFSRGGDNLTFVLDLLQPEPAGLMGDFFVRYHGVQVLAGVAAGQAPRVVQESKRWVIGGGGEVRNPSSPPLIPLSPQTLVLSGRAGHARGRGASDGPGVGPT